MRRIQSWNVIWSRWNEYRSWRPRMMARQSDFMQVSWAWFTFTVEYEPQRACLHLGDRYSSPVTAENQFPAEWCSECGEHITYPQEATSWPS